MDQFPVKRSSSESKSESESLQNDETPTNKRPCPGLVVVPDSSFKGNVVKPPNMTVTVIPEQTKPMKILIGNTEHPYGTRVGEMIDSTNLYLDNNIVELQERLNTEGYLFIRGAINRERAMRCRQKLIEHLAKKNAFVPGTKHDDALIACPKDGGWTVDAETGGFVADREPDSAIDGWREIGWCDEVRSVYAGEDLHNLYTKVFGTSRSNTHDGYEMLSEVTWLRAKGKSEVTAEHADYYYFKENTDVFRTNRHPFVVRDAAIFIEESSQQQTILSEVEAAREKFEKNVKDVETVKDISSKKKPNETNEKNKEEEKEVDTIDISDSEDGCNGADTDTDSDDEEGPVIIDGSGRHPKDPAMKCHLCHLYYRKKEQIPKILHGWKSSIQGEWHCNTCARQPMPVYTCWISLGDYRSTNSSLCVMPRSHCLTEFQDPINGGLLPRDYPTLVKSKWGWQRGQFDIGDIILFNVKTVHGASKNLAQSFRFSIDTRVAGKWFRPRTLYGMDGESSTAPFGLRQECDKAPNALPLQFVVENDALQKAEEEAKASKKTTKKKKIMGMGMSAKSTSTASTTSTSKSAQKKGKKMM